MKPQGKLLSEYALTELQEIIEFIYDRYIQAKKTEDRAEVRHWKEKYEEVAAEANSRVKGTPIWNKHL